MFISIRYLNEKVQFALLWIIITGVILFIFGWLYPHFLDEFSWFTYLYSAPIGVIPCATLSIVIGLTLILNNFNSRSYSLVLGFTGLFYGNTGIIQLNVLIDLILLIGAVLLVTIAFVKKTF